MHPQSQLIDYIAQQFPNLQKHPKNEFEALFAENLISPYTIQLAPETIQEIQNIVQSFYELRENINYQKHFAAELDKKNVIDPGNKSMMMSFDFHLDQSNQPRLIEINTNAAFLGLGTLLYQFKKIPQPVKDFSILSIKNMMIEEMRLSQSLCPTNIAIIDENPEKQRLYIEFLVFKEMFESFGWHTEILDCYSKIDPKFNYIYNRTTDFYLEDPRLIDLKQKYQNKSICLSPHPFEYFLLADKQRLTDWSTPGLLEKLDLSSATLQTIQNTIIKTFELNQNNKDELWSLRKNLFFKPKNAFGSKQSYKGQSISKKAFEELISQNCIAQEYIAAPEITVQETSGVQSYKYDLRAYAYKDQLQLIIARIYQGQVTNLRTTNGGFACVQVKNNS